MYGDKVAFWTAAAWAANPGSLALGLIMTIDAPLVFCWTLALYALWRAVEPEAEPEPRASSARAGWWALASTGAAAGLLSKQMMGAFVLLATILFAADRGFRRWFKRPVHALLYLVPIAAIVPVLLWNAAHDWIMFAHTAHHFDPNRGGAGRALVTSGEFVGSQILLASPVFAVLGVHLLFRLAPRFSKQDPRVRYLLAFCALPLACVLLMSFRQRINANWPVAFYPAATILLVAWACGDIAAGGVLDRRRGFFRHGMRTGIAFAVVVGLAPFILPRLDAPRATKPIARGLGWAELGEDVDVIRKSLPRPERTVLLTVDRNLSAELAFHVPGRPRTYVWPDDKGLVRSQYDLWPGPDAGDDALLLLPEGTEPPPSLVAGFYGLTALPSLRTTGSGTRRSYAVFLASGMRSWGVRSSTKPASTTPHR